MRLTSSITGIVLLGVIAADRAQGQSVGERCERRPALIVAVDTSAATDASRFPTDSMALPCPGAAARSSPIGPSSPSLLRVATRIGVATAVAQVSSTPEAWPQTSAGLLQRLADQSGAAAIQALTYHTLTRRLAWQPTQGSCPSSVLARTRCALARTLVVHDSRGAPRPDVARIAGLTLGSAGSLLWRPERRSGGDATLFVLTRVGSGLAFATLRQALARSHPAQQR